MTGKGTQLGLTRLALEESDKKKDAIEQIMDPDRPQHAHTKLKTFKMKDNERILDMKVQTKGNSVTSISIMVCADL